MGGVQGRTAWAETPEEACRKAAASLTEMTLPEVDRAFAKREIEVVAILKGNPAYAITDLLPNFPGIEPEEPDIILD